MNYWYEALSGLTTIYNSDDELTMDQRLKAVEIEALLAIGQELNGIRLGDNKPFD